MPKRKSMGEHLIKSAAKGAARGCDRGCVLFIIPFLVLILIFDFGLFTSCRAEKIIEEPIEDVMTETVEEEITETEIIKDAENNQIDDTRKKDYELFKEEIEDYDITFKAYEYSLAVVEIMNDYVDIETKTLKMTKEEVGSRFMELANKVQSDYFVLSVVENNTLKDKGISNITPEMIKAIDLICQWSETKAREFEYTAKYYWEEDAEYDIKTDELNDEATAIADEYLNLMNSMYLSINPE